MNLQKIGKFCPPNFHRIQNDDMAATWNLYADLAFNLMATSNEPLDLGMWNVVDGKPIYVRSVFIYDLFDGPVSTSHYKSTVLN
jgi:hypothetical protein